MVTEIVVTISTVAPCKLLQLFL